jgi:putative membrane protein
VSIEVAAGTRRSGDPFSEIDLSTPRGKMSLRSMPLRASVAMVACTFALGACGGGDGAGDTASGGDSATAAVSPPNGTEAGSAAAPAAAPASGTMTDANVAAIASAANQDEIQTSQAALQKGESAEVKKFARMMIDEHTRADQEAMQLLQAKGLAPQDNAESTRMKQMTQTELQRMSAMNGAAFDAAYMAHQVTAHDATLKALDGMLIPNATDPQMKAMLTDKVRPAVARHLEEARRIQGTLK